MRRLLRIGTALFAFSLLLPVAGWADQRVAFVSTEGNAIVKEGSLTTAWVTESGGIAQVAATRYRVGVLSTGGTLSVKEPTLTSGWVNESGSVTQFALADDRIAIVETDGSLSIKEGTLTQGWVKPFTSGVKKVAMAGTSVAVLMTNGSACLMRITGATDTTTAPCVQIAASNVVDIAVSHLWNAERVGYIDTSGNFYVSEGNAAGASPPALTFTFEGSGFTQLALGTRRIAGVSNNAVYVKEGDINASWSPLSNPVAGTTMNQIILSGTRVGIHLSNAAFYAFDGPLTSSWTLMTGDSGSIAFSDYSLAYTSGADTTVFANTGNACNVSTLYPDTPTRAFHQNGSVFLNMGNSGYNTYLSGSSLTSLSPACRNIFPSTLDTASGDHAYDQWVHGGWYLIGSSVIAFIHDEYHAYDPAINNCPAAFATTTYKVPYCWTAATTLASFTNGLSTVVLPNSNPKLNSVAWFWNYSPPTGSPPSPSQVHYGLASPSNIVHNSSTGLYYATVWAGTTPSVYQGQTQSPGMCLISSSTPAVPSSWHAYNPATGNFDVSFYGTGGTYSPEGQSCPVVGSQQIPLGMMPTQLTYNSYLGLYVMVGYSEGAYMLTSPDLINWSLPTKVIGEYWPFPPNGISGSCSSTSNDCYKAYPTLLDPADTSTNFESSGQTPLMFYTRFNTYPATSNRDLISTGVQLNSP